MLIIIADDHALVRESIADAMSALKYKDLPIEVLSAASYEELYRIKDQGLSPDLILIDYNMPGVDGFDGVKRVVAAFAGVPVVVVSGSGGAELARGCLNAGASGFIPKTVSMASLRNALHVVLDGEKYIHALAMQSEDSGAAHADAPASSSALPHFSEREHQVIDRLVAGGSNKEIARTLDLQEMTVKTHVRNIYRKLGVANRAAAVRVILESRIPHSPSL